MCGNMGDALLGALFGVLVMVPGGIFMIWWNEANQVCTSESYGDALKNVFESTTMIGKGSGNFTTGCDPTGKHGKFIHLQCPVDKSSFHVSDASTGLVADGVYKLDFYSEQYGYKRVSKKEKYRTQSGETKSKTCYCYKKLWTTSPVTSIKGDGLCWECNSGYETLPLRPSGDTPTSGLGTYIEYADSVSMGNGAFIIGQSQVENIANMPEISLDKNAIPNATASGGFTLVDTYTCGKSDAAACWYKSTCSDNGGDQSSLCLGDVRISVQAYSSDHLSVVGKESSTGEPPVVLTAESFGGSVIPPCKTTPIFYVSDGLKSANELFQELQTALYNITIVLRFVSFLLICLGFYSMLYPFEALVDAIPLIGDFLVPMVGCILYTFSFVIGLALWLFVFSFAWIFYRPMIGIPLFLLSLGFLGLAIKMQRNQAKRKQQEKVASFIEDVPSEEASLNSYGATEL